MNKNKTNINMKKIIFALGVILVVVLSGAYFVVNRSSGKQTYISPSNSVISASSSTGTAQINTAAVMKDVKWGDEMQISFASGLIQIQSNGIPNHKRDTQYDVPNNGVVVPNANTARTVSDPTKAQSYDFKITSTPKFASNVTQAPLGSIGIMISGSVLFNPYEGDGKTFSMSSNFYLTDKNGNKVWFVDSCSGHATRNQGEYHYHALSNCVTSEVDMDNGPSHITGIAMDGFPIYGNRDINGNIIKVSKLDECNGLTSPTPEFPNGIYHYVLPGTNDATSSIRCFKGIVDMKQLLTMPPMNR